MDLGQVFDATHRIKARGLGEDRPPTVGCLKVSGYPRNLMTPPWTRSRVMNLDQPSSTLTANRLVRSREDGASAPPGGPILMLVLSVRVG